MKFRKLDEATAARYLAAIHDLKTPPGWRTRYRRAFIESSGPLAVAFVKRNWGWLKFRTRLTTDEALSAALFGLVVAVDHFNPKRGTAFSTVAFRCMFDACLKADLKNKGLKGSDMDGSPAGTLRREKRLRIWHAQSIDSVQRPRLMAAASGDNHVWENLVNCAPNLPSATRRLREAIGRLPNPLRYIVRKRYFDGLRLRPLGSILHISYERVRQLQVEAVKELRVLLTQNGKGETK